MELGYVHEEPCRFTDGTQSTGCVVHTVYGDQFGVEHDDLELSVDVKFDDCLPSSASSSRAISPFQMVDERTL